jgi:type IV pilus assembly protein PilC
MARFSYTATKNGKSINGIVEATNREAAVAALAQQNIHPLIIRKQAVKKNLLGSLGSGRVRQKDIVVFTRQLSTMISAGVPLTRSLATLQAQADSKRFKEVVGDVGKEVEGGSALADAFGKHPDVFNEIFVSMVRAGEAGGILDEILKRLATQLEKDASIRKKIKSAMTYPVVILSITVIAFFGIMIFIIPKIGDILKDLAGEDAELPVYTQAMLGVSEFLQSNAVLMLVATAAAIFFLRRYLKTPGGKYKFHSLLLRIPIIKTVVLKIAIARFARTFASLMSSGVTVLDALRVTGGAIGNKVIEAELIEAAKAVKNGKQLSEPLAESKHFPMIVSQMLAVGEETGQIDTILVKVADFYEEEVDATIDALSSLIEPIMIIVLGSMVGVIAASVMGPIASLSKNVGE